VPQRGWVGGELLRVSTVTGRPDSNKRLLCAPRRENSKTRWISFIRDRANMNRTKTSMRITPSSQVKRDAAAQRRIDALQPGGEVQGNKLVHEDEHPSERTRLAASTQLGLPSLPCYFSSLPSGFFQRNVRRETLSAFMPSDIAWASVPTPRKMGGYLKILCLSAHPGERHFLGHNVPVGFTKPPRQ